ncbi:probable beta-tubulin polyglutamylase isoform X1 [Branchiostoma lanceolatum]|uniref:probable beta-tubulin polyglutamylase isoform X1 n=1 Tax=Branchiostoma lanceolatum TaxID=7740 RepID=UPI0034572D70
MVNLTVKGRKMHYEEELRQLMGRPFYLPPLQPDKTATKPQCPVCATRNLHVTDQTKEKIVLPTINPSFKMVKKPDDIDDDVSDADENDDKKEDSDSDDENYNDSDHNNNDTDSDEDDDVLPDDIIPRGTISSISRLSLNDKPGLHVDDDGVIRGRIVDDDDDDDEDDDEDPDQDEEVDGEGYGELEDAGEAEGEGDEEEGEGEGGASGADEVEEKVEIQPIIVKKKKKKKKRWIGISTVNCKYESVRRVARRFGIREVGEDEDWSLYWTDYSVSLERVMEMKRFQKINHFPGMSEICRKDLLARNMNRLYKLFPKEYSVFPKSWCMPADYGDFQAYCRQKKNKTFICKPDSGCQGRGIFLCKNAKDIKPGDHMTCQVYISKPFLIDSFKFDLRIYVLVTSCDPLRVYVFRDGLGRFATKSYTEPSNHNLDQVCMHLTNYAINKHSDDFIRDDECGSKRRITTVNEWLEEHCYDVQKMWDDIDDVIIKTLISAHPILKHNYRTCFPNHIKGSACFEILGFDIIIDRKLKPWLLEVNHSPSFHTDAPLDKEIKEALLYDTLNMLNLTAFDRRRCIEEDRRRVKERLLKKGRGRVEESPETRAIIQDQIQRYEDSHLNGFRRIYPCNNMERYEKFFEHSGSLFQETSASRARQEAARQQREEIRQKQEKMDALLKKPNKKPAEQKGPDGMRPESPKNEVKKKQVIRRPLTRKMTHREQVYLKTLLKDKPKPSADPEDHVETEQQMQQSQPVLSVVVLQKNLAKEPEPLDTRVPLDITEEEELERISGMLQRDNLVRGLGVVEHVYRLLHCTPGTTGYLKTAAERQYNSEKRAGFAVAKFLQNVIRQSYLKSQFGSNLAVEACVESVMKSAMDRQQCRRGLEQDINKLCVVKKAEMTPQTGSRCPSVLGRKSHNQIQSRTASSQSVQSDSQTDSLDHRLNHEAQGVPGGDLGKTNLSQNNPNQSGAVQPGMPSTVRGTATMNGTMTLSQWPQTRAAGGRTLGQVVSSGVHGNIPPSQSSSLLARTRYIPRKGYYASRNSVTTTVVPEHEWKHISSLMESENTTASSMAPRTTLAMRAVNTGGQKWSSSDSAVSVSSGRRIVSATGQREGGTSASRLKLGATLVPYNTQSLGTTPPSTGYHSSGSSGGLYTFPNLMKVSPNQASVNLSVVSGPAPVAHRPELVPAVGGRDKESPGGGTPNRQGGEVGFLRSTRSQRIRGATNNLRIKQLEMRENHAVVLS